MSQKSIHPDELEYIIWYGGSEDVRVEEALAPFRNRLRVIYGHDTGLFDSLGQVFPQVSGDVVSYLNVGDLWSEKTARFVLDVFRNDAQKNWICGLSCVYNEDGMLVSARLPFRFRRKFIRSGLYGRMRFLPVIQQESTYWRRELLNLLDLQTFRSLVRAGDAYMWARFAEQEELFVYRVALGGFREHENHLAGGYHKYQLERTSFQGGFKFTWLPLLLFDKILWRALDDQKISWAKGMIVEV